MSQKLQLVLASESPRRKDLLERAGFSFHVFSVKVSEQLEKNLTDKLSLDEQIIEIAKRKALASLKAYKSSKDQGFLILAADTMVILDRTPLGKPESEEQAYRFLKDLSGREHEVKTAVILAEGPVSFSGLSADHLILRQGIDTTRVLFRHLSDKEIREYIQTKEPMDKAGAYGIQGLGGNFVEKFVGAHDNVVGLPIEVVKKLLNEGRWKV